MSATTALKKIIVTRKWCRAIPARTRSLDELFKRYADLHKHLGDTKILRHVLDYFVEDGNTIANVEGLQIKTLVVAFLACGDPIGDRIVDVINMLNACHFMNVFELAVTRHYLILFVRIVPSKRKMDSTGLSRVIGFVHEVISRHVGDDQAEWDDVCDIAIPPPPSTGMAFHGIFQVEDVDALMAEL
ncbi:uncharacterized protein ISCGN_027390 [Ixodes scapularis]